MTREGEETGEGGKVEGEGWKGKRIEKEEKGREREERRVEGRSEGRKGREREGRYVVVLHLPCSASLKQFLGQSLETIFEKIEGNKKR